MTVDVQNSAGYRHGLALFLYAVVIERMKKNEYRDQWSNFAG